MLIWELEGEKYRVELPRDYQIKALCRMMEEKKIPENTRGFLYGSCPAIAEELDKSKVVCLNTGDPAWTMMEFPSSNWAAPTKIPKLDNPIDIYFMLVPLNQKGEDVSEYLKETIPDGTCVNAGYLFHTLQQYRDYLLDFNDNFHLTDEPNSKSQEQISWYFYEGCLISQKRIISAPITRVWDILYGKGDLPC